MESGTFGTLKNGNYELKQQAGMFGGRTTSNFLSGPKRSLDVSRLLLQPWQLLPQVRNVVLLS